MSHILIRKSLLGIFYIFAISLIAFFMSRQMPGDPAVLIANQGRESEAPPERVEKIRQEYGFDKSWPEQYTLWLIRVVKHGDLGISTRTHLPVMTELKNSLPVTLQLAAITFLVTVVVSLPLGLYAGITRHHLVDYLIQALTWLTYAVPVFLVANVFIWLFAVKYNWLPSFGHESWRHFVLPVAALSLHLIGWTTPIIRSSIKEITHQDYVRTAKSKGLFTRNIISAHILKPALLPIVTALLIQLGHLISGSFIIEIVFAWNGLGRLLVDSIMARDFPTIQGVLLFVGLIFALLNILIDLLYARLDPTISARLTGGQ